MPTVAEVFAQTLVSYGTEHYFCLTGGDHDIWIALHNAGIKIINCRNEASATYMADGYARVSGKPGFVYGQRGPGVANVAAAMADPYWAHSPVVSLTSSIALRSRDRFEYQDVDGFDMHRAVTRWNKALMVPQRTAEMVRAAIRAATGPVPGPVHLEIAADMLPLDAGASTPYREEDLGRVNARRLPAPQASIDQLVKHLAKAERPLIIAGNGVIISEAWDALTKLAESLAIPVVTTLGGKGAISESHRRAVGVIGRYSRRVANESVREADVVLVIGSELGGLATNAWALPLGDKPLYHIDTDPDVIGHNYKTTLGIIADAKTALEQMVAAVARDKLAKSDTAWTQSLEERVAVWREHAAALATTDMPDGIHPAAVVAELRKVMGPNDLLAADTGAIAAWAGALFPNGAGRTIIRSTGSLGWVVPGAMGACLARPDRRTIALTGDGGLLYHIGELETAMRCNIPVVIVVLNNRCFGSEHHLLKHRWGGAQVPEVIDFYDVDYAAIAKGFGAFGITVHDRSEIAGALKQALASNKPALVDIRTSKEAEAPAESYRGNSLV